MRIAAIPLAVLALLLAVPASAHADAAAVDAAYAAQAAAHPRLVTRVVYGESRGGRDLVAYRVGNSGPAVLYTAAQDGGDALAVGVQQRLFDYVVATRSPASSCGSCRSSTPTATTARRPASPSTATGPTTGASTTRAPATRPATPLPRPERQSEPEVAALGELIDDVRPTHLLDWREGDDGRIVYPESWQVQTPATDAPAMAALAGRDDAHSAIAGYSPGPAGELAIANGTLIDTAYREPRHAGLRGADPVRRRRGRRSSCKARDFALDLARSAPTRRPVSHLGNEAPDFVPHTFSLSYGRPQTVEVNARRSLGAVRVHWRVAGGPERSALLREHARRALRRARRDLPPPARRRSAASRRATASRSGSRAAASARTRSRSPPSSTRPATCSCSPPRTTPARIPARSTPARST